MCFYWCRVVTVVLAIELNGGLLSEHGRRSPFTFLLNHTSPPPPLCGPIHRATGGRCAHGSGKYHASAHSLMAGSGSYRWRVYLFCILHTALQRQKSEKDLRARVRSFGRSQIHGTGAQY